MVKLVLSLDFLVWIILANKRLPSHSIDTVEEKEDSQSAKVSTLPKWKETTTYVAFAAAVAGMILQRKIGDAGCVIPGLTSLVGKAVVNMLGISINPFALAFAFCGLTSVLATLTGSTLGAVYAFIPLAIANCISLGLNPTAATEAIVISG